MKKSILVTLTAFVLVVFVVLSFLMLYKGGSISSSRGSDSQSNLTVEQRGQVIKENQLEKTKSDTSFNGVIGSVSSPKGINVKILEVNGDIDDFEVLKNMKNSDFTGDSVEIPTIKKTFKVVVDEKTKLNGFNSLEDIKSGDQVKVDAGKDPRTTESFTAISLELNFRR